VHHQVGFSLVDYIEMHSQQNIKFDSNSLTHKHISIVIFLPRCTFILHEKNSLSIIHLTAFSTYHLRVFWQMSVQEQVDCKMHHMPWLFASWRSISWGQIRYKM